MADDTLAAAPGSGALHLRRVLALRDLVVVAAAAMGPAFSVATTMAAMIVAAGRWTPVALIAVAVLMAMVASGYKRLGERIRDAGSSYAWIRVAFGAHAGAYGAWVLLVANVFAVLATALPAGAYTLDVVAPGLARSAPAVAGVAAGWIVALSALLWYGLRPTALLSLALLAAEVIVLAGASGAATIHPRADAVAFAGDRLEWAGVLGAVVVGIWLLDGWEVSASTAEEAGGPSSLPGFGGLAGLALTSVLLLGAIWAFSRIGSAQGFAQHEDDALAYVGDLLGGGWRPLLSVTVLVSLAASLQTTLVYLTRSVYAMGRDGVLPRVLGRLDRRAEPAPAVVLIAAVSLACTVAAGIWPSAKAAFDLALQGTSWFLGLLFAMSAAAATRLFAGERELRWTGAILPGAAAIALAAVLLVAFARDDASTRGFIAASAIIGLPLAFWRGNAVRGGVSTTERSTTGSRF